MKWCDLKCEHASVENTENAAGACRREQVLYCEKYGKLVRKNDFCVEVTREMRKKDPIYQKLFGDKNALK